MLTCIDKIWLDIPASPQFPDVVANLLRHAADSPMLLHFPSLSGPNWEEQVLTIGPYEISSVMPNVVKLKLPKILHIHLVVSISRVKPYLGALPGQPVTHPGPHITDCDKEYKVDTIIDSCIYKGKLQYLVHWNGYNEYKRTWELVSNVTNSPKITEHFHKSHPSTPHHLFMAQANFSSLFSSMPSNLCDPFPTFHCLESGT